MNTELYDRFANTRELFAGVKFVVRFVHTVGFYGGKSRENPPFRLNFLKISICIPFKVVYHHLLPLLVKIILYTKTPPEWVVVF